MNIGYRCRRLRFSPSRFYLIHQEIVHGLQSQWRRTSLDDERGVESILNVFKDRRRVFLLVMLDEIHEQLTVMIEQ